MLIDGFLPVSSASLMFGPPKSNKTLRAVQMAIADGSANPHLPVWRVRQQSAGTPGQEGIEMVLRFRKETLDHEHILDGGTAPLYPLVLQLQTTFGTRTFGPKELCQAARLLADLNLHPESHTLRRVDARAGESIPADGQPLGDVGRLGRRARAW